MNPPRPDARREMLVSEAGELASISGRYATLIRTIDEGFCVLEVLFGPGDEPTDYRFLEVNDAFVRHTGLKDPTGRCVRELVPDLEPFWLQTYGAVALSGTSARFVHEARALDDRWFDVYAFRVDAPESRHVAVLFTDVTARTRGERDAEFLAAMSQDLLEVRQLEEFARTMVPRIRNHLELSHCSFLEVRPARRTVTVVNGWNGSDGPARSGEYRFEEFGRDMFWSAAMRGETIHVSDVGADPAVKDAAWFSTFRVASFIAVPLRLDGRLRHLLLLGRSEPSGWRRDELELARELAARCWVRMDSLLAGSALRMSEERLRLVLENAREYAIFAADLDRRVTSWNPGAERLLGYAEAEILGRSADIIFTREDRERGVPRAEAESALRDGRAVNERWHRRKDGSRFWGSGMVMTMQDGAGRVFGLLKIMRDQTTEQEARQALEHSRRELMRALDTTEQARAEAVAASQAKDQFLAALSHELRTPLNPVLMIASEAAADPSLDEHVRSDFDMIRKNIELEAHLIEDILDVSRISQGKLGMRHLELGLHQVLRDVVDTVAPSAAEKELGLDVHLEAATDGVRGDPMRLKQVFLNLVSNAIKFTPAGGRVVLTSRTSPDGSAIVVEITDTGIGMSEAELGRVFQPFAQGNHAGESGSPLFGGLGLGLAIVEELATRHGGRVDASSPGPGQGSSFVVTLPLAGTPSSVPSAAPHESVLPAAGRSLHILLVEDHEHTRLALERILSTRSHAVVAVGSRADALARAQEQAFDLLIADIGLPDGDGHELLGDLRRYQPRLAGIALSGFGMQGDLRRSRTAGFSTHLIKPVSASKLDQEIARVAAEATDDT